MNTKSTKSATVKQGALKLKEISYIHAEGYAAGELKHGPIAMRDPDIPVVAIATHSRTYEKVISNIQEVRARQAKVLALATDGDEQIRAHCDDVLYIPDTHEALMPLHEAQLLTYLKLTNCPVGLLINFNVTVLRRGIRRLVYKGPD